MTRASRQVGVEKRERRATPIPLSEPLGRRECPAPLHDHRGAQRFDSSCLLTQRIASVFSPSVLDYVDGSGCATITVGGRSERVMPVAATGFRPLAELGVRGCPRGPDPGDESRGADVLLELA
jgi:hypothetical protein